jgi:hypothetical protein
MESPSYSEWAVSEYSRDREASIYFHLVVINFRLTYYTRQIQHIYDNTLEEYPGVGVLTASDRDVWSKVGTNRISIYAFIQERGSIYRIILN